jgi:hypothetical protein
MIEKYLGKPHEYGNWDCLLLATKFYKNEFGIDIEIPYHPCSDKWMKMYLPDYWDNLFSNYGVKVPLTEANNYALIIFKSKNNKLITHFGLFLAPSSMLHIEYDRVSCIETLSDELRDKIHSVYNIV